MTKPKNQLNQGNVADSPSVAPTAPPTTFEHVHRFLTERKKQRIFMFELISYLCSFVLLLVYSFFPLLKIGHSSLGNVWQAIGKWLATDESPLLYLGERCVIMFPALFVLFSLIGYFCRIIVTLLLKKNRFFYIRGKQPFAMAVVLATLKLVLILVCIPPIMSLYTWYGFSGVPFVVIMLLTLLVDVAVAFHYQWTLRGLETRGKRFLKPNEEEKREIYVANFKGFNLFGKQLACLSLLFFVISGVATFCSLEFDLYKDYVVYTEDITQLHNFFNSNAMYELEKNQGSGLEDFKAGKITRAYSQNYLFYTYFIEETKEKIQEMYPDELSVEALEEYAQDVLLLEEDIETAKEMQSKLTYKYQETHYVTQSQLHGFYTLFFTNTNQGAEGDQKKWGEEKKWYQPFYEESIVLSATEFSTKTDFTKVNLLAHVTYNDGSYRISVIHIDNAEELNQADSGVHTLKWRDEWGTYEKNIVINESLT